MLLLALARPAHADEIDALYAEVVGLRDRLIAKDSPMVTLDQVRRSLAGETVTGTVRVDGVEAVKGYGAYLYDLPASQIWEAITDTPHHPGLLAIDQSVTVQGTPRQDGRITFQLLELPIVSNRWWIVQTATNGALYTQTHGTVWESTWSDHTDDATLVAEVDPTLRAEGIPVEFARGSWLLVSLGAKTWAEYYIWTDPGGSLPIVATNQFAVQQVAHAFTGLDRVARTHIPTCQAAYYGPDGLPMARTAP